MSVVPVQVPPESVVIGRGTPILHDQELSEVTEHVIDQGAPWVGTLLVDTDASVWCSIREQRVHVKISTRLNDSASCQTAL